MKYLITGFSGFVGRHFLLYIESLGQPATILGIDREIAGCESLKYRYLDCTFKQADLLNNVEWDSLIESFRPDYVLHLASFSSVAYSWKNPIASFSNNTNVFLNLLEKIRVVNPECRILSVGSSEEYGSCRPDQLPLTEATPLNPVSPYAVARVSQELLSKVYVDGFGCNIVMTRSFNHIGPGQLTTFVIASFASQLLNIKNKLVEPILVTGDISIVRDFVDVRDVVRAYDDLLKHGRSGEIYNICSGRGVSLDSVVDQMVAILGIQITKKTNPDLIRPNDNKAIVGSFKKIHAQIGWQPQIPLDQSLRDILKSLQKSTRQ